MLAGLAAALLGGCTVKTTVQLTATTPANVTHMYVTVKEIWFTSHAGARPGDGKWKKKELSSPVTIDLATLNNGTTMDIGKLDLGAGDYKQVRLLLADADAPLAESASDLNLAWNNAVQYVENGLSRLVPLEFASPGASLIVPGLVQIDGNTVLDALGSAGDATASVVIDVDALRGLAVVTHGAELRTLLDPGLAAYNDADAGTIKGTFDLTAISTNAINSSQGIVVSAERLTAGGTRRVIVKSARLASGGTFTLYPLPADDSGDTTYDIVVHGPGVGTVIVTGVTVEAGETTTLQSSAITVPASQSFPVNTATAVPGGTRALFHQSLPLDPAPFVVDFTAVHPFMGGFASDLALSSAGLAVGAYNDGELISFASLVPGEGAATYRVATDSRWRSPGSFNTFTDAATGPDTPQLIVLPQPALPVDAGAGSISGTIAFSAPDQFDALYLVVSRDGQVVETVDLGAGLAGQASLDFTVTGVPAGIADAVYEVSVRAWNSANAAGTLVRAMFTPEADLRQGNVTGLSLQL